MHVVHACPYRAYEQLKLRYESLELRAQQVQAQLATAQQRAGEAEELQERLGRLQAEHAALRATTEAATGSAAGELAALRATVASLRDELADLRSVNEVLRQQAARPAPSSGSLQHSLSVSLAAGLAPGDAGGDLERLPSTASLPGSALPPLGLAGRGRTSSDFGGDGLLSPTSDTASAQLSALAERERELAAARQRAAALEAELADLERECSLRQAQEQALKEAVRDLQREIERQRLPGKQGELGVVRHALNVARAAAVGTGHSRSDQSLAPDGLFTYPLPPALMQLTWSTLRMCCCGCMRLERPSRCCRWWRRWACAEWRASSGLWSFGRQAPVNGLWRWLCWWWTREWQGCQGPPPCLPACCQLHAPASVRLFCRACCPSLPIVAGKAPRMSGADSNVGFCSFCWRTAPSGHRTDSRHLLPRSPLHCRCCSSALLSWSAAAMRCTTGVELSRLPPLRVRGQGGGCLAHDISRSLAAMASAIGAERQLFSRTAPTLNCTGCTADGEDLSSYLSGWTSWMGGGGGSGR